MIIKALGIYIGRQRAGVLLQCEPSGGQDGDGAAVTTRFIADEAFAGQSAAPILSSSYLAETPGQQQALWQDVTCALFNGRLSTRNSWLLPAFFQNLLPEGVAYRAHIAARRNCSPKDHFEMLAACGWDLPGNVYARPVELSRDEMARHLAQAQGELEMSVTDEPMEDAASLPGVQPKLAVTKDGDRYVGRPGDRDTDIIAKLPVVGRPKLPELEHLSLNLAKVAGVSVCETHLEPLSKLAVEHEYDLGEVDDTTNFLAVARYDRSPVGRVHCEDFAQILGEMPEDKYGGRLRKTNPHSYLAIAAVLLSFESIGEKGVHELLRRLVVNEMLGNLDMHLKNIGLRYPDQSTPEFPPAYDIVAYAAYHDNIGHALQILPPHLAPVTRRETEDTPKPKPALSPAVVRAFCSALGIPEKPAVKALADCVRAAYEKWPAMILESSITDQQKTRLLEHFRAHPMVQSLARRQIARAGEDGQKV